MADAVSSLQVVVEGKDETTKVLKGIESGIIRFVGAVSASLAAVRVAIFPIEAASTFQRELLNVGKTTNFTDEQITSLGKGLKELSYQLNVSADDLAKIAAAGGQMGLGREGVSGILAFTAAASRMSAVLDISADDSGAALARLTNIFKINIKEAERISSLLNEISNNSTAKGAELIDMVQRIGTAGGSLTFTQSAALAATGRDLGLTVETVGTSFNKVFLSLQTKAAAIAPVLGMSVERFVSLIKTDGIAALKLYVDAVNKMGEAQQAAFIQSTVGGGRIFALMTSLAKDGSAGFEVLNRNMASASSGFTTGTSAIREQERVMSGLIAQGQILINVFVGVAEAVGRRALPYLTQLTKQLQLWAKDPSFIEFWSNMGTYIGSFADSMIQAIRAVSGLSSVIGPLLTLLKFYVGLEIVSGVVSLTSSLIAQGRAVADTTKQWYGLLTANQKTVTAVATAAREMSAKSAGTGAVQSTKSLSAAGRLATFLDTSLASKFAKQGELASQTQQMSEAERLLNERTKQRLTVLGNIRSEMEQITRNQKVQAQAAYNAVIFEGGTKKAATTAKNDSKAESNLRMLTLTVAESNLNQKYNDSLSRRSENLKSIANQAGATHKALAGMGTAGLVLNSIRSGIASTASVVGVLATRFIAVGGAVAAVIGLATYFLDMLGLLDPVVSGLKSILGIADSAKIEQQRIAAENTARLEEEKSKAEELAKVYDAQRAAKTAAAKAGASSASGNVLDGSLAREIANLQVINGKYADLTFKSADIASSTTLIETRWKEVKAQLTAAIADYDKLIEKQRLQEIGGTARAKPFGVSTTVSDKEVAGAKGRVDELTRALDLLGKAKDKFSSDAAATSREIAIVAEEAAKQAERLAPLFDEDGLSALRAFGEMLDAQTRLEEAQKAAAEAQKTGGSAQATDEEKLAYITAATNVKVLEKELALLTTSYEEMKLSSAGATVFMANAFPDAAKASVDKVQALVRVLGGVGEETNTALAASKAAIDKQVKEIDDKLAEVERKRKSRLSSLDDLPNKQADSYLMAVNKINADATSAAFPLNSRMSDLKAQQAQLALEATEAGRLKAAYQALGTAKRASMDKGRGLVSNFAEIAALKALTTQQIEAQRKVEEGAKFNADNIAKLYEGAKSALAATVNDAKQELASLGQYFASRSVTLKLANFDIAQGRNNEQYKKFQSDVLTSEQQRLEAQGLSTEEISKQMEMLRESFAWSDKIRQANQDEARQRLVINELQKQIQTEQSAINEASAKAVEFARIAKEAQAAGNTGNANIFATKAKEEAEKAKIATEGLTARVQEYKAEAAKPISGPLNAKFIVSDEDIKATVEGAAKARVAAAQANEAALAQASAAATSEYEAQSTQLGSLKQRAESYQRTLTEIAKLAPALGAAQEAIATKVLGSTEGMGEVMNSLQSIANSDFRGLDQFITVSGQAEKIAEMEKSLKAVAATYAESIVPLGASIADTTKSVIDSLGRDVAKTVTDSLATTKITAPVTFPDAVKTLQEQIDNGGITVPVQFAAGAGAGVQRNAEGGPIRGAGTGTSDSILSWLSHGEYVSDAQTTAFFGDNFFQTLKSIARGGRVALSRFSTKVNRGLQLPAFAEGGYVGASLLGAGGGIANLMPQSNDAILGRYAVDLNVGGEKVSLLGEREQVDALVKALHKMNRG